MIIVKAQGGLANQMFIYAFYVAMQGKQNDVFLDSISGYETGISHNGFELDKVFGLKFEEAPRSIVEELLRNKNKVSKLLGKLKLKLGFKKTHHTQTQSFLFDKTLFNIDSGYLIGYFQSEKYFKDIEQKIKQDFTFQSISSKNKELSEKMQIHDSISLHIRRGDYISNKNANAMHGNICTMGYYKKAINNIQQKVDNPMFYIFSDDIEWSKENLSFLSNTIFIDWNTKNNSYQDMYLMSQCQHNIIANSSFSWWGAWLNDNPNKIVLAPSKWVNDENMKTDDLMPDDWIKIQLNEK